MPDYVDQNTQTDLTFPGTDKCAIVHADTLTAPHTPSLPFQALITKSQLPATMLKALNTRPLPSSLLSGQLDDLPNMVAKLAIPTSARGLGSSPPTRALLSPHPANNIMFAGHTPRLDMALSPGDHDQDPFDQLVARMQQQTSEPDDDVALSGPLSLPSLPPNHSNDPNEHIMLDMLDERLRKLALQQAEIDQIKQTLDIPVPEPLRKPSPPPPRRRSADGDASRSVSKDESRRHSMDAPGNIDGVILRKGRLNFGAPFGQM